MPPHLARASSAETLAGLKARVADGERQDALLQELRDRVRHLRPAALAGPQDVKAVAVGHCLPAVVGGVTDPHHLAGGADAADFLGQRQCAQAVALN